MSEICKYTTQSEELIDVSPSEVDGISFISEYDEDLEKNIIQQLSAVNNPFLMKSFKDYIPPALYGQDIVDGSKCISANSCNKRRNKLFNRYFYIIKFLYIFN